MPNSSGVVIARLTPPATSRPAPQIAEQPASVPAGAAAPASVERPLLATVSIRTNLDPQTPAQLQVPVTPITAAAAETATISDYQRKQWEKRGFELSEERRYLPARLPDGREVVVPVNQVHLKFKGTPVS